MFSIGALHNSKKLCPKTINPKDRGSGLGFKEFRDPGSLMKVVMRVRLNVDLAWGSWGVGLRVYGIRDPLTQTPGRIQKVDRLRGFLFSTL